MRDADDGRQRTWRLAGPVGDTTTVPSPRMPAFCALRRKNCLLERRRTAAGVNISIPVFNGGLFSARRSEALFRAKAADNDVQDFSLQVSRDVQNAWYQANTAYRRLAVTGELVNETNQSLRLAQARYDAGLGGIVELNQAQLSQISAQIDAASAKYDYLDRRTALDYAIGSFR